MTTYEPRLGDTVEDTGTGKIGRVMGFVGPYVQLRPVGGGREWDARPDNLRAALLTQALSAGHLSRTPLEQRSRSGRRGGEDARAPGECHPPRRAHRLPEQ
ncbi:hypothetical protein GCM10010307_50330 [Streptomyces vastus]|uniref:Uncharacterized protein n=1 Tax=Streptomyces vastus TaxID=285451 RepID=A0ABP6DKM5_9ACTN